jgi:membrane-bound lytic murein transglycosylase F
MGQQTGQTSVPLVAVCFVGAVTAALNAVEARSLDEIKSSKELRVCVVASPEDMAGNSAEPAGCRDDCKSLTGYRYEGAMAFVEALGEGIEPKVVRIEWDEQFHNADGTTVKEASYTPELLASGTCDLYPNGLYEVDWRKDKLGMVTLTSFRDLIMVPEADKKKIKSPADLAGKRTAFGEGLAGQSWFEEQNATAWAEAPVEIEVVDTFADVIELVQQGKIDFVYMYPDVGLGPRGQEIGGLAPAFSVGPVYQGSWAVRLEDTDLQDAIQAFFDEQKPDPDSPLNRAWQNAFGVTLPEWDKLMKE